MERRNIWKGNNQKHDASANSIHMFPNYLVSLFSGTNEPFQPDGGCKFDVFGDLSQSYYNGKPSRVKRAKSKSRNKISTANLKQELTSGSWVKLK
jgi:hypothetical protein